MARGPHSSEIMASQGLFFFYEETSLKDLSQFLNIL